VLIESSKTSIKNELMEYILSVKIK